MEKPAICNACNKTIVGKILTALDKQWHPEHFACKTCRRAINTTDKFQERDGDVHCVPCYTNKFSPRCHGCQQPISGRVVQALGVSWHNEHFACGACGTPLAGLTFMEQAGRPYCKPCHADKFAARCKQCAKPITDKAIIALDAKWHGSCFVCLKCKKPLTGTTFQVQDNRPLCGKC